MRATYAPRGARFPSNGSSFGGDAPYADRPPVLRTPGRIDGIHALCDDPLDLQPPCFRKQRRAVFLVAGASDAIAAAENPGELTLAFEQRPLAVIYAVELEQIESQNRGRGLERGVRRRNRLCHQGSPSQALQLRMSFLVTDDEVAVDRKIAPERQHVRHNFRKRP